MPDLCIAQKVCCGFWEKHLADAFGSSIFLFQNQICQFYFVPQQSLSSVSTWLIRHFCFYCRHMHYCKILLIVLRLFSVNIFVGGGTVLKDKPILLKNIFMICKTIIFLADLLWFLFEAPSCSFGEKIGFIAWWTLLFLYSYSQKI